MQEVTGVEKLGVGPIHRILPHEVVFDEGPEPLDQAEFPPQAGLVPRLAFVSARFRCLGEPPPRPA